MTHLPGRAPKDTPSEQELDVREVPKSERHPLIFARFHALAVSESFVLVNSHDPKHLRLEFERDHPGAYEWRHLNEAGRGEAWRIRITRISGSDLPRVVGDTRVLAAADETDARGAVWKLDMAQRDLDANLIRLAAGHCIEAHVGPDLDVLLCVLHGSGELSTATTTQTIGEGSLVWLPRRSQRAIAAGPDGLQYLSVHTRRPGLSVGTRG